MTSQRLASQSPQQSPQRAHHSTKRIKSEKTTELRCNHESQIMKKKNACLLKPVIACFLAGENNGITGLELKSGGYFTICTVTSLNVQGD